MADTNEQELNHTPDLNAYGCKKDFLDLQWSIEFWKRIKQIPSNTVYSDLATWFEDDKTIISALNKLATYASASVTDIKPGSGEKYLAVNPPTGQGNVSITTTEALQEALDAWKGATTLTGGGDLATPGGVTITLGGTGAAAEQTVTITDSRAAKADQKLSGATGTVAFGETQTITLSGVTDAEGSSATITIPELSATEGASEGGNYVDVTVGLEEGELSVTVDDSAIDTKLGDYVAKDEVSNEGATVTLDADGTSTATTIANVGGTDITVTVNASAIAGAAETLDGEDTDGDLVSVKVAAATSTEGGSVEVTVDETALNTRLEEIEGAAEKIDASGSNGTLVNVEVAAKSSADGKGSVTVTVDETGLADKIEELEGAVIGGSDSDDANLITVTTAAKTAAPTVSAKLTASTATASAIATKEYVDEQAAAKATAYSFGDDVKFAKSTKEGAGANDYDVTIKLMKQIGEAAATEADDIVVTLDTTDFIKDGILSGVKLCEKAEDLPAGVTYSGEYPVLVFTFKEGNSKTETICVPVKSLVDIYTAADKSIDITPDNTIKVNTVGYLTTTSTGVDIDAEQVKKGTAEGASTKLATQGYVDEVASAGAITVDKTDVSAFGSTGSIDVKKAGTSIGKFQVTLPSFTAGTSTSTNASVSIANTGAITVTTAEQAAKDTETYDNSKLAQAGYVDEEIAKAKADQTYTAGNGINEIATEGTTKNQISVKAGSYVKVDASGVSVDTSKIQGYNATEAAEGDNNLTSKKYVDDQIAAACNCAAIAWTDSEVDENFPF